MGNGCSLNQLDACLCTESLEKAIEVHQSIALFGCSFDQLIIASVIAEDRPGHRLLMQKQGVEEQKLLIASFG